MSVFHNPEEHAANPPETWKVVKAAERLWYLTTADGLCVLDRCTTRKAAEAAREDSFIRRLYDQETRWYAGEAVNGWRPYADVCARP